MVIPIRTGLGLLVALLLMAAGSDQLLAQGTGPGSAPEQPPPGSQLMPTRVVNESTEDRSKYQQGDVAIGSGDNKAGEEAARSAVLKTMMPYVLLVIVVGIGIVGYFLMRLFASLRRPSHASGGLPAEVESTSEAETIGEADREQ